MNTKKTLHSGRQVTKKLRGGSMLSSNSREHCWKTQKPAPLFQGGIREGSSCCPAALPETVSAEWIGSLSLLSLPCGRDSQLRPNPKLTRSLLHIFWSPLKAEYFGAHQLFLADLGTHTGTLHAARSQRSSSQVTTPTIHHILISPSHLNNKLLRSQES